MIEEIKNLVEQKCYEKALKAIDNALNNLADSSKNEELYSELLHLHVISNHALGKKDNLISDYLRKEKFQNKQSYKIENISIELEFRNNFDNFHFGGTDAYVNTIHKSNLFNEATERSSITEFVKRLGTEYIDKELDKPMNINRSVGDVITLTHDNLLAKKSFHIIFYNGENSDIDVLKIGIQKVLERVLSEKLNKLAFFALGFDLVYETDEKNKNLVGQNLANCTAEAITKFAYDNPSAKLNIHFGFVSTETMLRFDKAFYKATTNSKQNFLVSQYLTRKEKSLINELTTKNEKFINIIKEIMYAIDDKSPILLLGETGVGKSMLAKVIHQNSNLAASKFVKYNCAAIIKENIDIKIFGAKKGSFSDGRKDVKGLIEEAADGTLFLDEIGYADLSVQESLYNTLDDGTYFRFGDSEVKQTKARFIFGTNVDIEEAIKRGQFRNDFYERISKHVFTLPPLRERKEDIALLVNKFLSFLNGEYQYSVDIDGEALNLLKNFLWPGNVRQLKLYIEKLFSRCKYKKQSIIDCQMIEDFKPNNKLYKKNNDLLLLEDSLLRIMKNWNHKNLNMLDDLIKPILINIYQNDLKLLKRDAKKIIGIDGSSGKKNNWGNNPEKIQNLLNLFSIDK